MLIKKRKNDNINNSKSTKILIKELDSFTIFDNLFNNTEMKFDELIDDIIVKVDEINNDIDFTNWIDIDIDKDEIDFINSFIYLLV